MRKITAETAKGQSHLKRKKDKSSFCVLKITASTFLHRCGGNARCTTCRVEILSGDPGEIGDAEKAILATKTDLNDHTRLSCQVRLTDDLHVKVVNQASVKGIDAGPTTG